MVRVYSILAYTLVSDPLIVARQRSKSSPSGKALTDGIGSIISCISSVWSRFATDFWADILVVILLEG